MGGREKLLSQKPLDSAKDKVIETAEAVKEKVAGK